MQTGRGESGGWGIFTLQTCLITLTETESLSCPLCNPGLCGLPRCYRCLFFLGDRLLGLGLSSNQGTICLSFCLAPISANAFDATYGARRWHLVAANF